MSEDRTVALARRLWVTPQVLALVVGTGWQPAVREGWPVDDPWLDDPPGHPRPVRGDEDRDEDRDEDDGPGAEQARRLLDQGLGLDEIVAAGLLAVDPRERHRRGGTRRARRPAEGTEWFVAGEPVQLMLGVEPSGRPLLARPEPGWAGPGSPTLDPVGVRDVGELVGCTDPHGEQAGEVRTVRDALLRRARRDLRHCTSCLRLVHVADTTGEQCHGCASRWLGVVY